jgi:hypothetical protein
MRTLTRVETTTLVLNSAARPPRPPRDRRNFLASYCSHRDHEGDVVFDPIYFGVWWQNGDRARLDRCLEVKRSLGVNAIQLAAQGGYPGYMAGATYDYRQNLGEYGALCDYIVAEGFTPIILVGTADGGTHVEIYNGQMARTLDATAHLAKDAWYCAGYEQNLDRGGAYNCKNMDDALKLMRAHVGDDGLLALWLQPTRCTPAGYWGSNRNAKPSAPDWNPTELYWKTSDENPNDGAWLEVEDPYGGDEQGAYYKSAGVEIDGLLYQTDHGVNGPSYVEGGPGLDAHGKPRWWDRFIEICDRFLAPGTPMPLAQGFIDSSNITHTSATAPSTSAPDWFHGDRRRGRPVLCLWETVPYEYTRDACSDEAVKRCSQDAIGLGVTVQGCWQPQG